MASKTHRLSQIAAYTAPDLTTRIFIQRGNPMVNRVYTPTRASAYRIKRILNNPPPMATSQVDLGRDHFQTVMEVPLGYWAGSADLADYRPCFDPDLGPSNWKIADRLRQAGAPHLAEMVEGGLQVEDDLELLERADQSPAGGE